MTRIRHCTLGTQPMLGPLQADLERRPIGGNGAMIMEVRLAKGFEVPRHNHPEEQFTYIIAGRLQFWTDDEPEGFIMEPGDIMHIPSNAFHKALALEDVLELDIFSPIRGTLLEPLIDAPGRILAGS